MSRAETCVQPQCALRDRGEAGAGGSDSRFLAELIVGILAGEDVRERIEPAARIEAHERCVECARRVMHDQRPLPTVQELRRAEEAAHWSWRRARKRR